MSTADVPIELHTIGSNIFDAFNKLADLPSECRIIIEEQKFRLWAHSLGLHQRGHSSLDYRVRDAVVVRGHLADILTELKEHLENRESLIRAYSAVSSFTKSYPSYRATDHLWSMTSM